MPRSRRLPAMVDEEREETNMDELSLRREINISPRSTNTSTMIPGIGIPEIQDDTKSLEKVEEAMVDESVEQASISALLVTPCRVG